MNHELVSLVSRVLDADWLSEHTGQPVRAVRLRVKPETSLSVALASTDDGLSLGWLRVLWPINHAKAKAALRDADKDGHRVSVQRLSEELVTVTGPIQGDPKLRRRIRRALDHGLLPGWPPEELLRYNPMRRLVVRDGGQVIRVAAKAAPREDDILDLIAGAVPCPQRLDDRGLTGCSVVRFTGEGDLENLPSRAAAERTGALLARLHATTVLDRGLREELAGRSLDPVGQGRCHADLLEHLSPRLAARTRATISRLAAWPRTGGVLSHGDLSPDQVLVTRDGERVWLTDFDRAQLAPVAADLGSFQAQAEPDLARAFRTGYETAAGVRLEPRELDHGIAWSWTLRLMDPLRHAMPDWEARVEQQLDRIDEVLS